MKSALRRAAPPFEGRVPDAPAGKGIDGPRWPWIVSLALSVAGLGVSAYLTAAHYSSPSILACPSRGAVNCARVTASSQSVLFGIPVAVLGLAWFALMIVASLPSMWKSASRLIWAGRLCLVWVGMGFVIWLIYAELFLIQAICLWCTVVHVVTFGLFVLVLLFGPTQAEPGR